MGGHIAPRKKIQILFYFGYQWWFLSRILW